MLHHVEGVDVDVDGDVGDSRRSFGMAVEEAAGAEVGEEGLEGARGGGEEDEFDAVEFDEAFHRRGEWALDADGEVEFLRDGGGETVHVGGGDVDFGIGLVGEDDSHKAAEGRVAEFFAVREFGLDESEVIVVAGVEDGGFVGLEGLNDDGAGEIFDF